MHITYTKKANQYILWIKGCTFQELGKQTTSSANFQAEHLLSMLISDSSTFCLGGSFFVDDGDWLYIAEDPTTSDEDMIVEV